MKFQVFFPITLLFLLHPLLSQAGKNPLPATTEGVRQVLETRVSGLIDKTDERNARIDLIREELIVNTGNKTQRKVLEDQLIANEEVLSTLQDQINCCRFVITRINELTWLNNVQRAEAIEDIRQLASRVLDGKMTYTTLLARHGHPQFTGGAAGYLPQEDCQLERSRNGKIVANTFTPFFSFTPPELEKHYPDGDFMTSSVRLLRSGSKRYLEMRIDFQSSRASQYYGIIEESSPMKMLFTDDDYIYLQNAVTAAPDFQPGTGMTTYKIQCALTRSDYRKIRRKLPDRMIILWPAGPETYHIFNFHTLQNLASCLERKI